MSQINRVAKGFFNRILGTVGLQLGRLSLPVQDMAAEDSPDELLSQFFQTVSLSGYTPKLIYDLGANRGVWTKEVSKIFPAAKYVLFEPSRHLQPGLASFVATLPQAEVRELALSSEPGVSCFSVSSWDVASRLGDNKNAVQDRYDVNVTTIDIQSAEDNCFPDIVKIDVEGEDLNVLIGAKSTLRHTSIVVIETGICYQDISNTAKNVINAMDQLGFDLMGITNLNPFQNDKGRYSKGILWLADFVFVRRGIPLHQWLSNPPEESLNASWH
ncbi:MAG: FkbM family methyltransferase [Cyanobacteriota bacterium]|nr:FkbM family methyltransferase [Cyanobacteriota bacterium]